MFMIKEIPVEERPRERFIKYPIAAISDIELIAIILRTGSNSESVIELSKRVLYKHKTLKDLSSVRVSDLTKTRGIGKAKAVQLLAAIELGKRVTKESFDALDKLHSPANVFEYMKDELEMKTQEHFIALYLNTKGELVHQKTLFIGSLNVSLVHPRELFKYAVLNSAATIIIVHNHPSGDPTPSPQDIDLTKMLHKNSIMMDIEIIDHIIIGKDKYYSFKEKKII